jgi:hypothetical protein
MINLRASLRATAFCNAIRRAVHRREERDCVADEEVCRTNEAEMNNNRGRDCSVATASFDSGMGRLLISGSILEARPGIVIAAWGGSPGLRRPQQPRWREPPQNTEEHRMNTASTVAGQTPAMKAYAAPRLTTYGTSEDMTKVLNVQRLHDVKNLLASCSLSAGCVQN